MNSAEWGRLSHRALLSVVAVAVALALHICEPSSFSFDLAALLVALAALVLAGSDRSLRIVAFLAAAATFPAMTGELVARWSVANFDRLSAAHLEAAAADLRSEVASTEARLQREATRTAENIDKRRTVDRAQLFSILERSVKASDGVEVLSEDGSPGAWWGTEFPESGGVFRFDVTNVYMVQTARTSNGALLALAGVRFPNADDAIFPIISGQRGWISAARLHDGSPPLQPGLKRFLLSRSGSSVLAVDLTPKGSREVRDEISRQARSVSAVLIALLSLLIFWRVISGGGLRARRRLTWAEVFFATALLLYAREAMLGFATVTDGWQIFGYSLYASRTLGPFSRSPFDLLLSAATILVVLFVLSRGTVSRKGVRRIVRLIQPVAVAVSGYLFVLFVENLIDNATISPLPDHIIPSTPAGGLLLSAEILLGFGLLEIIGTSPLRMRGFAGQIGLFLLAGLTAVSLSQSNSEKTSIVAVELLLAAAWIERRYFRGLAARVLARPLLVMLIVYLPTSMAQRTANRRFIEATYAPLVAGESSQLRSMISDALETRFSTVDLGGILPASFRATDLGDLAYALWLRSNFQVPSVITVSDLGGNILSRFGVGLPQFTEDSTGFGPEKLQVGSVTRELLHHDFDLTEAGQLVARGSVHVLDPTDPAVISAADVYRDFFRRSLAEETALLRMRTPVVAFDTNGAPLGPTDFRLPQNPAVYFHVLQPGEGRWLHTPDSEGEGRVYVRRSASALYAFPLHVMTAGQHLRRAGSVALWIVLASAFATAIPILPSLLAFVRRRKKLDFRARTSLYLTAVVILPMLIFVIFVRAYLAGRLEAEYLDQGQNALNTAHRVIEDYLASSRGSKPEQVLDDAILTWLARVIGHDLHLYRDQDVIASSRRDLFAARVEPERLPGEVYSQVVLQGRQLVRAEHVSGPAKFVEIYRPISLGQGPHYILALPFILQGRQIEAQVNDLATTIYLILALVMVGALGVAYRAARSVTRPVHALVRGARAVAAGDFTVHVASPGDPDLALLVSTFRDMASSIREQQDELRHERDRLQTLLENITAAVVVVDRDSIIVAANRAARMLFGVEEWAAGSRFDPRYPAIRRFLAENAMLPTASSELEVEMENARRTLRLSKVPLPEGSEQMIIAEDVTEILRSNRLEAWAEMARQVAHEIKNPLTPIQLTAEHLRAVAERDDPRLPDLVRTSVDNILRQVSTLKQTSHEFSDYASLRMPARAPVDLCALLKEIAAGYHDSSARGVRFEVIIDPATPCDFRGDARLLRGAIVNLVENALQANSAGGWVKLENHVLPGEIVIEVRDGGPGVPTELLPKIFDPYFSTKSSGTGLGLAIARKTVEEHGGSIEAESSPEGFLIRIHLPDSERNKSS